MPACGCRGFQWHPHCDLGLASACISSTPARSLGSLDGLTKPARSEVRGITGKSASRISEARTSAVAAAGSDESTYTRKCVRRELEPAGRRKTAKTGSRMPAIKRSACNFIAGSVCVDAVISGATFRSPAKCRRRFRQAQPAIRHLAIRTEDALKVPAYP